MSRKLAARHSVSVGVGVGVGPRGYGAFGYPIAYPGFYGNGMSMYGPPVPTYAPIPGTFGGSDYRVNQNAPFIGSGVGVYGYRTLTPRPLPGVPNGSQPPADGPDAKEGPLFVEVRLPIENAIVFINGELTRQDGPVRVFASPILTTGLTYKYDVRAEWIIDGKKISLTQTVSGKAGGRAVADFTK